MLERTAGCLETGSLRRLLPASKKSLKSRRTLHSGFWTHGASDLECSPLWTALVQAASPMDDQEARAHHSNSTTHSAMLLDFLYPTGTMNFLRTYSGWGTDRQDARSARGRLGKLGHRQYTSAAMELASDHASYPASTEIDGADQTSSLVKAFWSKVRHLRKSTDFEDAWDNFMALPHEDQDQLRHLMISYLATSNRIVDAERLAELFGLLRADRKDAKVYREVIRAYLRLENMTDAMEMYNDAIKTLGIPAGSQEILAYLVQKSQWQNAAGIWKKLKDIKSRPDARAAGYRSFEVLESLPNFGSLTAELSKHIDHEIEAQGYCPQTSDLIDLAAEMIRNVLLWSSDSQSHVMPFMENLQKWNRASPEVYEEIIIGLCQQDFTKIAIECYQRDREAENAFFTKKTLHRILRVFCDLHDVSGIKQVLDDFFQMHERPTRAAYKMCMQEFASQGDAKSVHSLFDQYLSRFKKLKSVDELSPVLHVHAKRGEIDEVVVEFHKIQSTYGLQPSLLCWNILLHAYAMVQDVDGAYQAFDELLNSPSVQADSHTFGTMMGLAARRGDTALTTELFAMAEDRKIEKTMPMYDTIVISHCYDNDLRKAEQLCEMALKMNMKGSKTRMWNYLINAYGAKRDLAGVNRILQRMAEVDIEYDQFTYGALMQALCMNNQPDLARKVLKDIVLPAGVQVTSYHYAILMAGYIQIGQADKVFKVQRMMNKHHGSLRQSGDTNVSLMMAELHQAMNFLEVDVNPEDRVTRALEIFKNVISTMDAQDTSASPRYLKGAAYVPLDIAYPTMIYKYMMYSLNENGEFDSAEKLYDAFQALLPERRKDDMPLSVLAELMETKLLQHDFEKVDELWQLALRKATETGRPLLDKSKSKTSRNGEILYRRALDIQRHLTLQLQSKFAQRKADELEQVYKEYLACGFAMDHRNNNIYCSFLARSYQWKLAFTFCEDHLMEGFLGWNYIRRAAPVRNRISLEIRNPRKMVKRWRGPKHKTLMWLAKSYLEMQASAVESLEVEKLMKFLERECPRTLQAVRTLERTDDEDERLIFSS